MDRLTRYRRFGNRTVQGWLEREAMELVTALGQDQLARDVHGTVAEIGVHHGRLFILLALLRRPGETALAIDLFENQELNLASGRGDRARLVANIERHVGSDEGIELLTADSSTLDGNAVRASAGGPVRLFSVDGGHTAALARHDMLTADGAVDGQGVIILDDYFNEAWPGVSTGVAGLFLSDERPDLTPFAISGNKVFFARPAAASTYTEAIVQRAEALRWHCRERELLGAPVLHISAPRASVVVRRTAAPLFRRGPGAAVKRATRSVLSRP